ncbi:hypothetical protein M405DRAFT_843813 [Rhizopogon salebrosus TDB-379]|nr:hypothetical protein M405DRAFT_843813 [Rhizopogon salebrosus TDB-379]
MPNVAVARCYAASWRNEIHRMQIDFAKLHVLDARSPKEASATAADAARYSRVPIDYPQIFSTTHTVLKYAIAIRPGLPSSPLHILTTSHIVRQHRVAGGPIFTSPCASRPLFSDGPPTIHTTHYPEALCAGPGTLSLARLIRPNNERIRLQECRPAAVDVSLHDSKEIVDLRKNTLDTSDNEALKVLLDLLNKLVHDLRTALAPLYVDLLEVLLQLRLLPRPISAPSLTAFLAILSGILRYLPVPSIKLDLLDQTWSSFRAVLLTCSPEVQHAAVEVWGSVLRQLKSIARQAAVLMAQNLESAEDARAWMVVFACKFARGLDYLRPISHSFPRDWHRLPLDASFHSEILSFTSSLLTVGDMAMSAGPGRAFVI